jgi:hypothetical protein
MFTINELPLPGVQSFEVDLPIGTEPIAIIVKNGVPIILAKVPSMPLTRAMEFDIVPTGIPTTTSGKYLGTVTAVMGAEKLPLTFHVFWQSGGSIIT